MAIENLLSIIKFTLKNMGLINPELKNIQIKELKVNNEDTLCCQFYPYSSSSLEIKREICGIRYDVNKDNGVKILKETSLSLNQIEFIFKKLSEAYIPVFKKHLKGQITISNLIQYAIDALSETKMNGSQNRILITNEFKEFARRTEAN